MFEGVEQFFETWTSSTLHIAFLRLSVNCRVWRTKKDQDISLETSRADRQKLYWIKPKKVIIACHSCVASLIFTCKWHYF